MIEGGNMTLLVASATPDRHRTVDTPIRGGEEATAESCLGVDLTGRSGVGGNPMEDKVIMHRLPCCRDGGVMMQAQGNGIGTRSKDDRMTVRAHGNDISTKENY